MFKKNWKYGTLTAMAFVLAFGLSVEAQAQKQVVSEKEVAVKAAATKAIPAKVVEAEFNAVAALAKGVKISTIADDLLKQGYISAEDHQSLIEHGDPTVAGIGKRGPCTTRGGETVVPGNDVSWGACAYAKVRRFMERYLDM